MSVLFGPIAYVTLDERTCYEHDWKSLNKETEQKVHRTLRLKTNKNRNRKIKNDPLAMEVTKSLYNQIVEKEPDDKPPTCDDIVERKPTVQKAVDAEMVDLQREVPYSPEFCEYYFVQEGKPRYKITETFTIKPEGVDNVRHARFWKIPLKLFDPEVAIESPLEKLFIDIVAEAQHVGFSLTGDNDRFHIFTKETVFNENCKLDARTYDFITTLGDVFSRFAHEAVEMQDKDWFLLELIDGDGNYEASIFYKVDYGVSTYDVPKLRFWNICKSVIRKVHGAAEVMLSALEAIARSFRCHSMVCNKDPIGIMRQKLVDAGFSNEIDSRLLSKQLIYVK